MFQKTVFILKLDGNDRVYYILVPTIVVAIFINKATTRTATDTDTTVMLSTK